MLIGGPPGRVLLVKPFITRCQELDKPIGGGDSIKERRCLARLAFLVPLLTTHDWIFASSFSSTLRNSSLVTRRTASTSALPSSTAETSAKAPQKLPNGVLTLPAEWISSSFALSP